MALRIHLERNHDPGLRSPGRGHTVHFPPCLGLEVHRGPSCAAQHVHEHPLFVVLRGGEALGRAGGDLAPLREELRSRSPRLLDGDGFSERRRTRLPLAGGNEQDDEQRPSHCFIASPSASPSNRIASSIWPLLTTIGGAMRSAFP